MPDLARESSERLPRLTALDTDQLAPTLNLERIYITSVLDYLLTLNHSELFNAQHRKVPMSRK